MSDCDCRPPPSQDTNTTQYELTKLLRGCGASLFVVGDPDQAIYTWRGADASRMAHAFHRDFPNAKLFHLHNNYR